MQGRPVRAIRTAVTAVDPGSWEKPERKVVSYWRISGLIGALLFGALLAVQSLVFFLMKSPHIALAFLGGVALIVILRGSWVLLSSHLRYRRLSFVSDSLRLRIRYGVLVHREKIIPVSRLQHVDIDQGPLERWFGLASLTVFTAGGRGATFRVSGLTPSRAEALREQILGSMNQLPPLAAR